MTRKCSCLVGYTWHGVLVDIDVMFRQSLLQLFLGGHFETPPDCDLTDFDIHDFLPNFLDLNARVKRTPHDSSWPSPSSPQVMSTRSSTRILPWKVTRFTLTIGTTIPPTYRKLWEERSRLGCQGPQRKYARYLSTTLRKLKVSGSRNSRVIKEMMSKEMK